MEPFGSPMALYEQDLINIFSNRSDFHMGNTNGQPTVEMGGVWRTHSTFDPVTQRRRSSNTLLDRENPNLTVKTKAKVARVIYDGDEAIPFRVRSSIAQQIREEQNQRKNQRQTTLATARCVRLTSLESYCVRYGGRIYISSGVIHTPHVLINSGIGPNGNVVDNPNVGQNLVDKPALFVAGSFQPGFDHLAFAHIGASRVGVGGVHLWEDLNNGVDSMLLLASWQRNFVPVSLRNSWFANAAVQLIDFCDRNIDDEPTPNVACNAMVPLVRAGCYKNIVGVANLISEPTSRGSVMVENGRVKVDVNYLSTDLDLQAFGATVRTGHEVMSSFTGRTALQQPCADKTDRRCMKQSCPELIKDYVDYTYNTLRVAMPGQASKMRLAPASMLYPQFVEPALADENNDDLAIGKIVRDDIFAAHHFAGTAAVGTVVDSSKDFAVIGVEGLYVVDASMLKTTTRCNPMATVMALGHIAGLQAVDALSSASSRRHSRRRIRLQV
jgi:choline dehydrogenase-like flavoprotein